MKILAEDIRSVREHLRNATTTPWFAYDRELDSVQVGDIYFFLSQQQAIDSQKEMQEIGIAQNILPVQAVRNSIKESVGLASVLRRHGSIELDHKQLINEQKALDNAYFIEKVRDIMEHFDWSVVQYDPSDAFNENRSPEDAAEFERLDWFMDEVTWMYDCHPDVQHDIESLLKTYWKGQPMEVHIEKILNNKSNNMNADNLKYIQDQLLNLGFGEGLNSQLERQMKEGLPEFQLNASHEFGRDKMEAVLHFKKSDKQDADRYFFNTYDATLQKEGESLKQRFYINNKGQSVTFKESCNLLNGRSVFKKLTPKEGAAYEAWVKLDFSNRDESGNAKLQPYNNNYGFDLKEAVARLPFKELNFSDETQTLMASLEKGNRVGVMLVKGKGEQEVFIEANPRLKTMNMYDKEGQKMFYPAAKQEVKYGQAPADQKKLEAQELTNDVKEKKKDLLPKKTQTNGLLEKKATRKAKGQRIA